MNQPYRISDAPPFAHYEEMTAHEIERHLATLRDPASYDQTDPELPREIALAEGILLVRRGSAPEQQPENPLFSSRREEIEVMEETRRRNARRYGTSHSPGSSLSEPLSPETPPIKLSESGLVIETPMKPELARKMLRDLSDPQQFDQTDPLLLQTIKELQKDSNSA